MKNERGSPIPDLLPAVGLTQLHNGDKNAASTRQQDKRFYKEVSIWETPAALRYCRDKKQLPGSCCPGRFSTKACPNPFTALTGTFLFALWSELRVSKMEPGSSCLWGVPGAAEHSAFKLKKCGYNLYFIVTIFNQHLVFFMGITAAGWLFSLSPLHCFSWVVSLSLMASHSSLELRHCCIFMI